MKIRLMTVYVDDQDKALRFYTEVLGFAKKTDFSQGPYRWLTLASAEEPDGAELQLERNDNPAAKAFQQARFQQGQPAAMFYTDDVQRDYERMKAAGAEFMMPPTKVTGSTIAMVNDTSGNLIQIAHWTATVVRLSVPSFRCDKRCAKTPVIALRPRRHFVQDGTEAGPERRQAVLHLQMRLTHDGTGHQSIAFQLAQLLNQYLVGHIRHRPLKIVEAPRSAAFQQPQNQRLPLPTDDVDRELHGARIRVLSTRRHPRLLAGRNAPGGALTSDPSQSLMVLMIVAGARSNK